MKPILLSSQINENGILILFPEDSITVGWYIEYDENESHNRPFVLLAGGNQITSFQHAAEATTFAMENF